MLIGSSNTDMKFIIEKLSFKVLTAYRLRIFIIYHDRTHNTGPPSDRRTLTKAFVNAQILQPDTQVHGLKFPTMSTDKRLH
jgi:hypothetical protein